MGACEWCGQPIQTLHFNNFSFTGRQGYFCSERCRQTASERGVLGTQHPDPTAAAPAPTKGGGCGGTLLWLILVVVAAVAAILVFGQ